MKKEKPLSHTPDNQIERGTVTDQVRITDRLTITDLETITDRAKEIIRLLDIEYPDAHCSLDHEAPWQLLISTILAAQCTDERVNIVTKTLFKKYTSIYDFAKANQEELEMDIISTGFFRNKAKNIIRCANMIVSEYNGVIPGTMNELLSLPGVGRKTANVILGTCFGVQGIIVDTHCGRLARRIGLTKQENPERVEKDLMEVVPFDKWTDFSHLMVYHGRAVCNAKKPKCSKCVIFNLCDCFPME